MLRVSTTTEWSLKIVYFQIRERCFLLDLLHLLNQRLSWDFFLAVREFNVLDKIRIFNINLVNSTSLNGHLEAEGKDYFPFAALWIFHMSNYLTMCTWSDSKMYTWSDSKIYLPDLIAKMYYTWQQYVHLITKQLLLTFFNGATQWLNLAWNLDGRFKA